MRSDSSQSASSSWLLGTVSIVVRAIEARRSVDAAGTGGFEESEEAVFGNVLRLLKHHVLEEVRKSGSSLLFVDGSDVIPDIHRDLRQPVILDKKHIEPVGERVFLDRNLRDDCFRPCHRGSSAEHEEAIMQQCKQQRHDLLIELLARF